MRFRFLDNDSMFGRICTFLGTLIVANLLFIVTILPVITAGAGLCGLFYTMLRLVREKEINPFREFFHGFKDNFKQATLAEIIAAALILFLAGDIHICSNMTGILHSCIYVAYAVAIAAFVIAMYLFPCMVSFEGRLRDHLRNSVFFAGRRPLTLLLLACVNIVPMALTYSNLTFLPLCAFVWSICGFSLTAFVDAMLLMRQFKVYLEPKELEPDLSEDECKALEDLEKLEGLL